MSEAAIISIYLVVFLRARFFLRPSKFSFFGDIVQKRTFGFYNHLMFGFELTCRVRHW